MTDAQSSIEDALDAIAENPPLVVSYTNAVTINEVANTTLNWGALPVMSEDVREASEMVALADACLINMGTVDQDSEERMITAGRAASREGTPVAFDPVGVGATSTRTAVAERILDEVDVSIIKGNYGEITALAGSDAEVRGVESVGEYGAIVETAIACARDHDAVVVASGETDIVAHVDSAFELAVGDPMMGRFVGSGCMLGVTVATFLGGLGIDRRADAAITGTAAFGLAGERAAGTDAWNGPASYQRAFLDSIAQLASDASEVSDLGGRVESIVDR